MKPNYAITKQFNGEFNEAVEKMKQALSKQGFGILTEIDVKKTLKAKLNIDYQNYRILGACNPPNAYKALQSEIEIGLLLPCNVVLYEDKGSVYVSIIKPTVALTISNNDKLSQIAQEVESKLITALNEATN